MTNNSTTEKINVLIVDDHELVRDGIQSRLQLDDRVRVCGQAANGQDACKLARELSPDVIFMDISMPGINGLEAAEQILKDCPSAKILFLSIYDNSQYIREALKVGAKGYILKDVSAEEMQIALFAIYKGGTYLASKAAVALSQNDTGKITDDRYGLTHRETEILCRIAKGKSNREIADEFSISVRTVESHRMAIREKTGGGNAATLSIIAQELNLV